MLRRTIGVPHVSPRLSRRNAAYEAKRALVAASRGLLGGRFSDRPHARTEGEDDDVPAPPSADSGDLHAENHPANAGDASLGPDESTLTVPVARTASSLQLLAALAVIVMLWWAQSVIIPVVLSLLLGYALEPLILRFQSWHLPRLIAVPIVMTLLFGLFVGAFYGLRGEATAFVDRVPSAVHTVSRAIQGLSTDKPGTVTRMRAAANELEAAANTATKDDIRDGITSVRVKEPTFRWSDWLWQGSRSVTEFFGQMFAVICLTYYLLASGDLYKRKLVRLVPTFTEKKITVQILAEIDRQIERFLFARLAISVIVGMLMWIAFRVIGVSEAGVWGVLAAVLYVVPVVGPTLIVAGSAIASFVQFGSIGMASAVGGAAIAVAAIESNVLTPWLMSRVGEMNAVAVFVCLIFWGWIWGVWGLLLAVPIMAAAKAVSERVPSLSAFAELLGQ